MNKVISFVKSIRLKQILTVFFAGVLLFLNTACSASAQAKMPDKTMGASEDPHPVNQVQPYQGGMNNYSDTAPGQAARGTAERTKALIDRAERDINTKRVDSVDQYVENYRTGAPIQERTKNIIDNVKEAAGDAASDARGVGDRVSKSGERAADRTKELGSRLQQGANDVSDNLKVSNDEAGMNMKQAARKASRAVEDATTQTKRAVKDAID